MEISDPLHAKLLSSPMSSHVRRAILNEMFKMEMTEANYESFEAGYGSYFTHWYEEQCSDRTGPISKLSQADILHIVELIKDPMVTYEIAKAEIPQRITCLMTDAQIETGLVLAARLLSISSIGTVKQCLSFGSDLAWNSDSLCNALQRYYWLPLKPVEDVKIPKLFNAVNINRIAGIKICWTSNLLDHLQMTNDDKTVHIFHHVSFLKLHQKSESPVLGKRFIEETLGTLALLLPQGNANSSRWFEHQRKRLGLDPAAGLNGHLNASSRRTGNFPYWGERLYFLKQAFDDSEPKSVTQWWYDDRKRVQWYTFWIAALVLLLTVVFGIIQSVASIIQAWATVNAMH